jgi:16S rRNA U516 pseudouridylate synthase RsuA-like enzyme
MCLLRLNLGKSLLLHILMTRWSRCAVVSCLHGCSSQLLVVSFCRVSTCFTALQVSDRVFNIALQQGRNRQIRKMCEAVGYSVVVLHRHEMAGIKLTSLKPGRWCALNSKEMRVVQAALRNAGQHA